jgi:hypothetical protein
MLGRLNPRAGERDPVGKKRPQRRGCIWRNRPIRIARQDQHPSSPEKSCLNICRFEALSIQQDQLNGNNPGKADRNELFQNVETFTAAAN